MAAVAYLSWQGYSYYTNDIGERVFHADYQNLKPSGVWGHGMGILGTFLILFGVVSYIVRKRWRKISRWGTLKNWLEFHIFLCTLGPVLILFHTSFKFGGLVAVSFWSMVAVFVSGVIGRFIYIRIPRSIEGRELSLGEVSNMKKDLGNLLRTEYQLSDDTVQVIIESTENIGAEESKNIFTRVWKRRMNDSRILKRVRNSLKNNQISKSQQKSVLRMVKDELVLNHRIKRLLFMQTLFKYWHVAHLPFAFVMLIIVIIHVIVTLLFGYRWIF